MVERMNNFTQQQGVITKENRPYTQVQGTTTQHVAMNDNSYILRNSNIQYNSVDSGKKTMYEDSEGHRMTLPNTAITGTSHLQGNNQQIIQNIKQSNYIVPIASSVKPQVSTIGHEQVTTQIAPKGQVTEVTYELQQKVPVTMQVIEQVYEIEKPIYVENIIEEYVEEIVERPIQVMKTERVDALLQEIGVFEHRLNDLKRNAQQVQFVEDNARARQLQLENDELQRQIRMLQGQKIQPIVQETFKEVPVDHFEYIDKQVYIDNHIFEEVPVYQENIIEVMDNSRADDLRRQIAMMELQLQQVEYVEKEQLIYENKQAEIEELQLVERPVYKENIVTKDEIRYNDVPHIIERVVEVAAPYDTEIVQEVPVERIVTVPREVIRKEIIKNEVVRYVDEIEYIENIIQQEQYVEIPKLVYVDVPYEVEKIKTVERPYQVIEKRVTNHKKNIPREVNIDRPYNVHRTVQVPQQFNTQQDIIKKIPVPRKKVQYIERPQVELMENIIKKPKQVFKNIEQIRKKIVEIQVPEIIEVKKQVYREVPVENIVVETIEVDHPTYQDVVYDVEQPQERVKYIDVPVRVIKEVEVPYEVEVFQQIDVDKVVEKKVIEFRDKPMVEYYDKVNIIPREVQKTIDVPIPQIIQREIEKKIPYDQIEYHYNQQHHVEYQEQIVNIPRQREVKVDKVIEIVKEIQVPKQIVNEVIQEKERIVEIPQIQYIDKIYSVDKVQTQQQRVEVPKLQIQQERVEAPKINFRQTQQHFVTQSLDTQYQTVEVTKLVEVPRQVTVEHQNAVENRVQVEIPEVQYVDRQYQNDKVRKVEKYVDDYKVNYVTQTVEYPVLNKRTEVLNVEIPRVVERPEQVVVETEKLRPIEEEIILEQEKYEYVTQNVEVENIVEEPIDKEVKEIWVDNARIGELQEQIRKLRAEKEKIKFVELIPEQAAFIYEDETHVAQNLRQSKRVVSKVGRSSSVRKSHVTHNVGQMSMYGGIGSVVRKQGQKSMSKSKFASSIRPSASVQKHTYNTENKLMNQPPVLGTQGSLDTRQQSIFQQQQQSLTDTVVRTASNNKIAVTYYNQGSYSNLASSNNYNATNQQQPQGSTYQNLTSYQSGNPTIGQIGQTTVVTGQQVRTVSPPPTSFQQYKSGNPVIQSIDSNQFQKTTISGGNIISGGNTIGGGPKFTSQIAYNTGNNVTTPSNMNNYNLDYGNTTSQQGTDYKLGSAYGNLNSERDRSKDNYYQSAENKIDQIAARYM